MEKLATTISSLEKVGLNESATTLRLIQKLYKTAQFDFTEEIRVLEELSNIALYFQDKDLKSLADQDLSLPSYSMETGDKYINFSSFPLKNYSKKEIFSIGIPDYLRNFTKLYMKNRLEYYSGAQRQRYRQVMENLGDLDREIVRTYKKLVRPIEYTEKERGKSFEIHKNKIDSERKKLNSVFSEMNQFETSVTEHYVPLLAYSYGGTFEEERFELLDKDEAPGNSLMEKLLGRFKEEEKDWPQELGDPVLEEEDEDDEMIEEDEESVPSAKEDEMSLLEKIRKGSVRFASIDSDLQEGYQKVLKDLANLTDTFSTIRDTIDSKYARQLDMDVAQFRKELNLSRHLEGLVKSANKDDIMKRFDLARQESKVKEKLRSMEISRKVTRDIINGKVGYYAVRPGQKRKSFNLYEPTQVIMAWTSLNKKLSVRYEAFIKTAVRLYTTKKDYTSEDYEETRRRYLEEKNEELSEQTRTTDQATVSILKDSLELLRSN